MSLYNALHGRNPFSGLLLAIAGVKPEEVPRFRDTHLFEREDGELGIAIYTRTGGGNRTCYCRDPFWLEDGEERPPIGEHKPGCYPAMNRALAQKSNYLHDEDDDFDSTYATFYFRVPEALQSAVQDIASLGGQTETPADAWERLFGKLSGDVDDDDEEVRHAMEVGQKILAPIMEKLGEDSP